MEERAEEDAFPTTCLTNTQADVERWARSARLAVESFEYLGRYPNYLMFSGALSFLGICYEKLINLEASVEPSKHA